METGPLFSKAPGANQLNQTAAVVAADVAGPLPPIPVGVEQGWVSRRPPVARRGSAGGGIAEKIVARSMASAIGLKTKQQQFFRSEQPGLGARRPSAASAVSTGTSFVPGRGQVVRPSTTPAPSSRGTYPGHAPPAPEDENMSVEVTMLREEVRRLQAALLERFRGNSKFVSGGQFRGYAKVKNEPEKCAGCANMRGTVKRVRGELRDLRAHCEDLDRKLSDAATEKQRLEMQLQHSQENHSQAMGKLMEKLKAACKGEEQQAAIVQQLRAELATLKSKTGDDNNKGQEELQKQRDSLLQQLAASKSAARRVQELEADLRKSQAQAQELGAKFRRVNHQLQEAKAEGGLSKEQLQEAEKRISELEQECTSMGQQLQALRKRKNSDDVEIDELRRKFSTCEDEKVQVVLKLGQLKGQLNAKEASLNKSQRACQSLKSELKALQEEHDRLKRQYEGKCGELKTAQGEILTLQEQIDSLRKRLAELEEQLKLMKAQASKKQEEVDSKVHQNEFDDLRNKLQQVTKDLGEATSRRTALQQTVRTLESTVEDLNSKLAEQERTLKGQRKELEEVMARAKEQQRLQAKALETAMQSLVRLCVVAPTVNVHLGDQTMGCKAPLPQVLSCCAIAAYPYNAHTCLVH